MGERERGREKASYHRVLCTGTEPPEAYRREEGKGVLPLALPALPPESLMYIEGGGGTADASLILLHNAHICF